MKITSQSSPTTIFNPDYESSITFHPSIILFDKFSIVIDDAWGKTLLEDIDTWSAEKIYKTFKDLYDDDEIGIENVRKYEMERQELKEMIAKKYNGKEIAMQKYLISRFIAQFKKTLNDSRNETYKHNKIQECIPFIKDGIFIINSVDFKQMDNKEHVLISEITKVLSNRKEIQGLHHSLEQMYSHVNYDEMETDMIDFLKIPLWDIPFLDELTYKQLKYTRNALQPVMAPFKIKLQEFWDEINTIQFIDENIEQLKQLCQSKLQPFVQPLQQTIDESLYISQIRNKSQNNNKLTLCLGITSVDKLIQYYEKVETVLPYVASEIKQQASRYLDLKAAQLFVYFKIHTSTEIIPEIETIH